MYKPHRTTRPSLFSLLGEKFGKSYTSPVNVRETGYPLVVHISLEGIPLHLSFFVFDSYIFSGSFMRTSSISFLFFLFPRACVLSLHLFHFRLMDAFSF